MLRFVLDTNVVLDLFHWANTDALSLLHALETGRITCFADARTLDELQRVLNYPQLKLTPAMQAERWARYSKLITRQAEAEAPPLPRCRDRDDQKFLELAARIPADCLVSKDKALLKLRGRTRLPFRILTPAAASRFLEQMSAEIGANTAADIYTQSPPYTSHIGEARQFCL
ncbi:putative toxin-antitoxin system toxin component, PIN family [Azonexus sp.]|uniref:putative toxin-antitoxin system toxin component, PIN family n=1 Tax=Azonexus sp. TaxID=1872668 RepID=UPI0039E4E77C